jgi:hypothetical protein
MFVAEPGGPGRTHAEAMAACLAVHAPKIRIRNAAIFGENLSTSVGRLCDALDWMGKAPPALLLCSFGLERLDPALAERFAALRNAGTLTVASAPARGGPVYPASLPGSISVQGDARCEPADWSHLALPHARFGAHVVAAKHPQVRGASAAAAHFCGHLAARLGAGEDAEAAIAALEAGARHKGRERRGADD